MKAQKIFKMIFGFYPNGEEQEVTYNLVSSDILNVECRGMERELQFDEENIYDEEGEFMFLIYDLEWLGDFKKFNECPDCFDTKLIEVDKECFTPASYCCGSCIEKIECSCLNKPFKFD